MRLPFRKKKWQGDFGYQLFIEMQIHLTRKILVFANYILQQKISKQIKLHVLALLEYECEYIIVNLENLCNKLSGDKLPSGLRWVQ